MTFQWSFKFILVVITRKKQFCNIFLSIEEDSTVILCPPQPMKFMTTRWRMTLAKIKSANALSGEIHLKSDMLSGLLWTRRQTKMKTKDKINIIPQEFKQRKVLRSHCRVPSFQEGSPHNFWFCVSIIFPDQNYHSSV